MSINVYCAKRLEHCNAKFNDKDHLKCRSISNRDSVQWR